MRNAPTRPLGERIPRLPKIRAQTKWDVPNRLKRNASGQGPRSGSNSGSSVPDPRSNEPFQTRERDGSGRALFPGV